MQCVGCSCTDEKACRMPSGQPCRWVLEDPPICSACLIDQPTAQLVELVEGLYERAAHGAEPSRIVTV